LIEQAITEGRNHRDPSLTGYLADASSYLTLAGAPTAARALVNEALVVARLQSDYPTLQLDALSANADLWRVAGDRALARRFLLEARALALKLQGPNALANVELDLGAMALEDGDPAAAEALARRVLAPAPSGKGQAEPPPLTAAVLARAHDLLAEALIAKGELSDAHREIEAAAASAPFLPSWRCVLLGLNEARLDAAEGRIRAARRRLRAARQVFHSKGLVALELQVRLVGLQIERRPASEARALAAAARRQGFTFIAKTATSLVAKGPPRQARRSAPEIRAPSLRTARAG
jgi:hypothetical protein